MKQARYERPSMIEAEDLPAKGRRVLAVGGGKGGVGKSLVATSLAVYLAQIGRKVVLVDADPTGANLHLGLGVERTERSINDAVQAGDPIESVLQATTVPGLRLLVGPTEASASGALKAGRKLKLLRTLRDVVADDLVIDCGPGTSVSACDLFLSADLGILVTVPEPAAIETTFRFVRAMFVRDLRRLLMQNRNQLRALDRVLTDLGALPLPLALCKHLLRVEAPIGEVAVLLLLRTRPRLIVNQTRVRTDIELGPWMTQIASRRTGVEIDPLGHIEHDDAVWLANRRKTPLLVDNPSSKAGRCLERIVRRILAVLPHRQREVEMRGPLPTTPNLYERLLIQRGSSEEEVRRAHKKQREIYAHGGLPTVSLFNEDELDQVHRDLDEAHDVLLDPVKRRTYDISVFPDHEAAVRVPSPAERTLTMAAAAELVELQAQVSRELGPDTEFTGSLLRRIRESRGIELREIANKTKITYGHLSAIEEEDLGQLPPLVYVRGFLMEIAKFLKLDEAQVARTYLRRARDLMEIRGG